MRILNHVTYFTYTLSISIFLLQMEGDVRSSSSDELSDSSENARPIVANGTPKKQPRPSPSKKPASNPSSPKK